MINPENLNDSNSSYIGDGLYAHMDDYGRMWVLSYNGISVLEQVCFEYDATFQSLIRFYNSKKDSQVA